MILILLRDYAQWVTLIPLVLAFIRWLSPWPPTTSQAARGYFWMAVSSGLWVLHDALFHDLHNRVFLGIDAAWFAWNAWMWWKDRDDEDNWWKKTRKRVAVVLIPKPEVVPIRVPSN